MRHPWFLKTGVKLGKGMIRALLATCRIRITGLEGFLSTVKTHPTILILWHCHLTIVADVLYRNAPHFDYAAFISNSRDGEPLALLTTSYPRGHVIRVPHNSRHFALKEAIQFLNAPETILIVTPDGPRGPSKVSKPGVAAAAIQAQAMLVPFGWKATRTWKWNTWDQMLLPKPFSTIDIQFGEPFRINPEESLVSQIECINRRTNNCSQ